MAQGQLRKIEHQDYNNTDTSDESISISTDEEKNWDDELQGHENLDDVPEGSCNLGWGLNTWL